jgi:hypothetical protein
VKRHIGYVALACAMFLTGLMWFVGSDATHYWSTALLWIGGLIIVFAPVEAERRLIHPRYPAPGPLTFPRTVSNHPLDTDVESRWR